MSKERKSDLTVKIFALVIAIILWSYVMNDENPIRRTEIKDIEVSMLNQDELNHSGVVIMSPHEIKVDVKLSGRRKDIINIDEKDIVAKVDVSGYSEGEKRIPIYIEVPSNVELLDYSPKEVLFKFESIVTKEKPVVLKTVGKLGKGYSLGKGEVRPQSVFLKGPKSWVNSVNEVIAEVDVTNKTKDINVSVPIKLVDDQGKDIRGVEKDPNAVEVEIPIYRIKKVPIEIETIGELPEDYEINNFKVTPSVVELKGYEEALKDVTSIKTVPIDINELIRNKSVETDLVLPEGVELLNPDLKVKVGLNLERIITKSFDLSFDDITVNNLGEDLYIENKDTIGNITVNLKGQEKRLDSITSASIEAEIDLSRLDEGTHDVPINIKDIDGITVESVVPSSINIMLKKQ